MTRSDAHLAQAAGNGDGAAFAELYDRHADAVYGFAHRMLRASDEASDATQQAFLNTLARLRTAPEGVDDPRAYLFRCARNACLRTIEQRSRVDVVEDVPESVDGPLGDGEVLALTSAVRDDVRAANELLPERQQEVLALRELSGMSYAEIGDVMGLSPNAVAQLVWRARLNLRSALRRRALASIAVDSAECERAMNLTVLAEDSGLSEPASRWLSAHVDDCSRCSASRAVMAEAGALYRLWLPAPIAAVPALREAVFARAGEIVGADWSGLASSVAPGGSVSPSPSSGGIRSVPPAVVAVMLALVVAGGAFAAGVRPGGADSGDAPASAAAAPGAPAAPPSAGGGGGAPAGGSGGSGGSGTAASKAAPSDAPVSSAAAPVTASSPAARGPSAAPAAAPRSADSTGQDKAAPAAPFVPASDDAEADPSGARISVPTPVTDVLETLPAASAVPAAVLPAVSVPSASDIAAVVGAVTDAVTTKAPDAVVPAVTEVAKPVETAIETATTTLTEPVTATPTDTAAAGTTPADDPCAGDAKGNNGQGKGGGKTGC